MTASLRKYGAELSYNREQIRSRTRATMSDKYHSFIELAKSEVAGRDYDVVAVQRPESPVVILAPHGGDIEPGTSELATLIAGAEHNLFTFSGLKPRGNRELHIRSDHFDHPDCLALLSHCAIAVGIHGCMGGAQIYVGGLDDPLATLLTNNLAAAGLPATRECPKHLAGREQRNICNRGTRGRGAQLEITKDLRAERAREQIAAVARITIATYSAALANESA